MMGRRSGLVRDPKEEVEPNADVRSAEPDERNTITGKVAKVVDAHSILVEPRRSGWARRLPGRRHRQMVRIRKIRLGDVIWLTGTYTRKMLEATFRNRQVTCLIRSREKGGAIVADVYLS